MSAVKVNISSDSDSLVIKKGVTLIYACNDQTCRVFGKNTSRNLDYLSFDFRREICKLSCIKCSKKKVSVKAIGFYKTDWTIKYIDNNRNEATDSGPATNIFEARGPIRLDIWKLVRVISFKPEEPKSYQLWVLDADSLRKIWFNIQDQRINVWSLKESIQEAFGIKPEHQVFYFKEEIVYEINTSLVSEEVCLSVKDIKGKCRTVNFNIRPFNQSFLISVENYEKYTVLDALFILAQLVDIKSMFEHNIIILKLDGNPLEFEDNLNKIQDYEEIVIDFAPSVQQIIFFVRFRSEINKEFTFNGDTITKDLLYILSLYYKIKRQWLQVLHPAKLLSNLRKTIIQNGMNLNALLILE